MINWRSLALITFIFAFISFQGNAQIKLLSAQILSSKDSSALVGVHIVNMNTLNATNSYSDGTFLMPFKQGDTIRLSSIGYADKFIYTESLLIPDAIQVTIFMDVQVYNLKEVDVQMYQSKEEFAEDFKDREIESQEAEVFKYEKPTKVEDVETDLNAHIPLGSPITFLYSKFSKEAKEQKRLAKAEKMTEKERIIQDRYNIDVIKKVTGITSDEEAKQFMENCPLEDEYVYKATDYDIVKKILECQRAGE